MRQLLANMFHEYDILFQTLHIVTDTVLDRLTNATHWRSDHWRRRRCRHRVIVEIHKEILFDLIQAKTKQNITEFAEICERIDLGFHNLTNPVCVDIAYVFIHRYFISAAAKFVSASMPEENGRRNANILYKIATFMSRFIISSIECVMRTWTKPRSPIITNQNEIWSTWTKQKRKFLHMHFNLSAHHHHYHECNHLKITIPQCRRKASFSRLSNANWMSKALLCQPNQLSRRGYWLFCYCEIIYDFSVRPVRLASQRTDNIFWLNNASRCH